MLDINKKGILADQTFFNKESMNNIKFTEDITDGNYSKTKFIYEFLYSVRQKINDPLGKKKIK